MIDVVAGFFHAIFEMHRERVDFFRHRVAENLQQRFLRIVQGEFERVGAIEDVPEDVRCVTAEYTGGDATGARCRSAAAAASRSLRRQECLPRPVRSDRIAGRQ